MEILVFTVSAFQENCFVVKDGGEAIVIDPGDTPPELLEALEGLNVRTIVNTHTHIDHVAGNAGVKEKTGAELACHRDAAPMLESVPSQGSMMGMKSAPSPAPDRFLDEGDKVTFGDQSLDVVYVPGHAPGHIALIGGGFAFVGDVLFAGSIGRTDLAGGSFEQLITSIKTKLLVLPDETVVYCGHGQSTTIGTERLTNPFLV